MPDIDAKRIGIRAEKVTEWYFRLNGFMLIPGFVVHPDVIREFPRTEADLIGVRFPHSSEYIGKYKMVDDELITFLAKPTQTLFILVEVKAGMCRINGPWSRSSEKNMHRVIRRMGFAEEQEIDIIATQMYSNLRWENEEYVLQYISVGNTINEENQEQYKGLKQITWQDIGLFLFNRFNDFPAKLPNGNTVHSQWPDFGKYYGQEFRHLRSHKDSIRIVRDYIYGNF